MATTFNIEPNENDPYFVSDPAHVQAWLQNTGLAIQLADYEPEENVFLSAHGPATSILVVRIDGLIMLWAIDCGTKEERKEVTAKIRAKFEGK